MECLFMVPPRLSIGDERKREREEEAEKEKLPPSTHKEEATRGYYGHPLQRTGSSRGE